MGIIIEKKKHKAYYYSFKNPFNNKILESEETINDYN